MSIAVDVGMLSGTRTTVNVGLDDEVETLKERAQTALGAGKGYLLDSCGRVLDARADIKTAGVQNGDTLSLHITQVQVQATASAFAAILGDGSVLT